MNAVIQNQDDSSLLSNRLLFNNSLKVFDSEDERLGKAGEGGSLQVTNLDFLNAIFFHIPKNAHSAVCSKMGDPNFGGWSPNRWQDSNLILDDLANNFVNCSTFFIDQDNLLRAKKENFAACHFLMLDDLGTKVSLERLGKFELSWLIETSPGNHQGGVIFQEPICDGELANSLLNAIIEAGLCDAGSTSAMARWARLPVAINGKLKHKTNEGGAFKCRLLKWNPNKKYSFDQILNQLQLDLKNEGRSLRNKNIRNLASINQKNSAEVLVPKSNQNPIILALKSRSLYKSPLGSLKHDITCPWVTEHTDKLDTGAVYFEPNEFYPIGGFRCQHSHGAKYRISSLLEYLCIENTEARHKPIIRVIAGEMDRVLSAAEEVLAARGRHYQSGGLIVSVSTDPTTGDPFVVPTSAPALTRELSIAATWEKYDSRSSDWVRSDPPTRHVTILYDSQIFRVLPPLAGVVRQPYFVESNRALVTQPGYDKTSHLFGVFDARHFLIGESTYEGAKKSLNLIEDLLSEFQFVNSSDKAAALAAIFTAVVRSTIPYAPAFHVSAPVFGSGKTYLCELIGTFAGPGGNSKVSYPTTSEEATKVILSLLLTSPAVIEFDDMSTNWIPHGTINRMLTAEHITDRILGVSKTATVSTRTLFLGSGNNVGPIGDLLRRVLTIHIDPRCSTPATKVYKDSPVETVRKNRGKYVSAVLTIIQAYFTAGMPKLESESIASFGGAWSDYCRYPIMWLGYPDPGTSLIEQIRHDPDGEALAVMMTEWYAVFGSVPTTIRKVIKSAKSGTSLYDSIQELQIVEKGEINSSKLGWIIKKNTNRIINNFEFQKTTADGRTAWKLLRIKAPPLPPLPTLNSLTNNTVDSEIIEVGL